MAILSKMKRDKREFLIGVRDLKFNKKKRLEAIKTRNQQIASNNYPEDNDKAFAKRIIAMQNIERQ